MGWACWLINEGCRSFRYQWLYRGHGDESKLFTFQYPLQDLHFFSRRTYLHFLPVIYTFWSHKCWHWQIFHILSNDGAMERTPGDGCDDDVSYFILITDSISHQPSPEYTSQQNAVFFALGCYFVANNISSCQQNV